MFLSENTNSQILHPCGLICFYHIGLILIYVKRKLTSARAVATPAPLKTPTTARGHVLQHIVVRSQPPDGTKHARCSPTGLVSLMCRHKKEKKICTRSCWMRFHPRRGSKKKKKTLRLQGIFLSFFFFSKGPRGAASVLDLVNEV